MSVSDPSRLLDLADRALNRAVAGGAEAADAFVVESLAVSSTVRLGALEEVERSESLDLGLRVFVGDSQAIVSTSELGDDDLDEIAVRAVEMAKAAPPDPDARLPDRTIASPDPESLDLFDDYAPSAEELHARAGEAEQAALAVKGVSNSIGSTATHGVSGLALAASNGFSGHYRRSNHSLLCIVLAGEGTAMEKDHEYGSKVHRDDLETPQRIGKTAGERAVRRLGGRKMSSRRVPVVYHPRVASQLLSNLARAASGAAVARGASFLKDSRGERVFSDRVGVVDDPLLPRGGRSRPFDAEGRHAEAMRLVDGGVLTDWLLDCRTARRLGLRSNGRASRGVSTGPSPSPTNLYMEPGTVGPDELIEDVKDGFFVMGLMGRGGSVVTGDYSEGANGFWIENGEIAHPVTEVTVAGNLADMYKALTPADDLEFRGAVNAPTLRIEGMTVAGN